MMYHNLNQSNNRGKHVIYIIFISYLIMLYISYRLCAPNIFKWNIRQKTIGKHFIDMFVMIYYFTLIFYIGNYYITFPNKRTIITSAIIMFIWGYFSTLRSFKYSLISVHDWTTAMWVAVIMITIIIITLTVYHLHISYQQDIFKKNMLLLLFCICNILVKYLCLNTNNRKYFHLHHWFLFMYLSVLTTLDNNISKYSAGLCIGISMHGISHYGPDSIYD